jgi:hypothetical protein
MKRSWLIGAALVFSLTAVGCDDDDADDVIVTPDGGKDAGGGAIDGGLDSGLDATVKPDGGDAGDAG